MIPGGESFTQPATARLFLGHPSPPFGMTMTDGPSRDYEVTVALQDHPVFACFAEFEGPSVSVDFCDDDVRWGGSN